MSDACDYLPPLAAGDRLRHFKGGDYTVLAVGVHSETHERLVAYQSDSAPDRVWVRPLATFTDSVGKGQIRFVRIATPRATSLARVLRDVAAERARQDAKWGGAAHDDDHGFEDWREFRREREQAIRAGAFGHGPFDAARWYAGARARAIEIAALAVAQVESLDRHLVTLGSAPEATNG